jgi:hypothetical protein
LCPFDDRLGADGVADSEAEEEVDRFGHLLPVPVQVLAVHFGAAGHLGEHQLPAGLMVEADLLPDVTPRGAGRPEADDGLKPVGFDLGLGGSVLVAAGLQVGHGLQLRFRHGRARGSGHVDLPRRLRGVSGGWG